VAVAEAGAGPRNDCAPDDAKMAKECSQQQDEPLTAKNRFEATLKVVLTA